MLTTLFSFDFTSGANPFGGLLLGSDGMFYGTTFRGGAFGGGTVFKFSPAGLSIQSISGDRVVVSWIDPTRVLQSAANATGVYTNVVGASSPYTNTVTGSQKFFRVN